MDTSTGSPKDRLTLVRVNDGVFNVRDPQGLHVGNLKLIAGCWKFKAVGHGPDGELVPGGGPLTKHHNTVFDRPDAAEVGAGLGY
jgi:hypothetical protein